MPEADEGGAGPVGGVAEAQREGALAVDDAAVEVARPFGSDAAAVADALDPQQASVGGSAKR